MNSGWLWLGIGFLGQALFSARFIVQWLASERAKRSIVPKAFWFLSIAGGATLLAYAIYRRDPVFIAGQGAGLFIYARNLVLIRRESREVRQKKKASAPSA
ncbi:lipid-A-disaccharide synthase N-terminal domain-containing protein [Halomonas sp. PR-M31]|uniref:lipid-A-disaccharide synthase N-terminal domain-containing protein n=1 Tax=Halomonas sp. PR-M31 TaxID=1471202 RepID=UPI0006511331|nr:lipid-A-disaccharide synthase N-terminal domain-containing protein [Halomonas sp. PR-M31]